MKISAVSSHERRTAIIVPSERPRGLAQPRLVVIAGPDLGRQIDLNLDEVDIGRGDNVRFRIDSEQVSRRHAAIRRVLGRFAVADLESTNGTFVNDERIKTHTLREGDRIRIGKVVLKYTECEIEASYHQQILERANVDGLTGAYNKRYYEETMRRMYATNGPSMSLLLFDIDYFKKINDTWGHAVGDLVLKEVVLVARGQLRIADLLCRVGGEEFAVILEGARLEEARGIAERIRTAVERSHENARSQRIPVTLSIGVAERTSAEPDPEALYKRADGRLYQAKHAGRNRVV